MVKFPLSAVISHQRQEQLGFGGCPQQELTEAS